MNTMPALYMPRLISVTDRAGCPRESLAALLRPERVTAFVGGGGKTATALQLARELAASGARVIVSTTTHIRPVVDPPRNVRIAGTPLPDGRLGIPEDAKGLIRECDFLLLEADGSRGLPAKAPESHEPALPDFARKVIAVQGLTAFERPIWTVCHRPGRVASLLGKTEDDLLLPDDGARLLASPQGQLKGVGARPYAVVLNQADGERERGFARQIIRLLPKDIDIAVTAYAQGEQP